ncbi:hypothetical protein AZE42_10327 [Rhizopogon vesiculosus]|uniref:Protein kinase domain-containing protein n=1 Tax=Rhizopogon vesiculosus TaxID=180088 RepID=A0A1J8QN61_9AGAM|nr:hypothetical protein AZE42_10327 [Rhizopogon vesiculosus]
MNTALCFVNLPVLRERSYQVPVILKKKGKGKETTEKIRETTEVKIEFHERYWSKVCDEAKTFIKSLLNLDPSQRPTAQLALNNHRSTTHKASTEHDVTSGLRDNFDCLQEVALRHHIGDSNASNSGSGGWGEDHMNGEIAEDAADAEDAGDGETDDRSNQLKASLSLGGINLGSN